MVGAARVDCRIRPDRVRPGDPGMTTFIDDDRGYLSWIRQNPLGFVLNTNRTPTPEYLILHKATCPSISGLPSKGEFWTKDLIKQCADHQIELRGFARVECGGDAQDCGMCQP